MTRKSLLKKLALLLLIAVLVVVAVNYRYFWLNVRFLLQERGILSPSVVVERKDGIAVLGPDMLVIERLSIKAPIVYPKGSSETDFQNALRGGVVHYPDTARPGEPGNVFIFGHSSDLPWARGDYKTVFALLPQIGKGDDILVSDPSGNTFKYTVIDTFQTSANNVALLDQGDGTRRRLTLQTSYPIGTALRRWIVIAELK